MKRWNLLARGLLLTASLGAATLGGAPPAAAPPALLRTTLLVVDVERTAAFYALLGFAPERDLGGPRNPDSAFPLDARTTRFRLLILASAHPASGRIGLLSASRLPRASCSLLLERKPC